MLSKERQLFINGFKEAEHNQSTGVGLYIMGPGRTIWSTLELDTSSSMEQKKEKLSIPIERRQKNESILDNMRAALGEFCGFEDVPGLSSRLFIVGKPELTSVFAYNQNRLCTLVPMACYANISPTPFNLSEVKPMGWRRPEQMLLTPSLRSIASQLIRIGEEKKFWEKGDDRLTKPDKRIPVFGPDFSAEDFISLLSRRDPRYDILDVNGNTQF